MWMSLPRRSRDYSYRLPSGSIADSFHIRGLILENFISARFDTKRRLFWLLIAWRFVLMWLMELAVLHSFNLNNTFFSSCKDWTISFSNWLISSRFRNDCSISQNCFYVIQMSLFGCALVSCYRCIFIVSSYKSFKAVLRFEMWVKVLKIKVIDWSELRRGVWFVCFIYTAIFAYRSVLCKTRSRKVQTLFF